MEGSWWADHSPASEASHAIASPGSLRTALWTRRSIPMQAVLSYALVEQSNGQLVVAGAFSSLGGQPRSAIARLAPDGSLDAAFAPAFTGGDPTTVRAVAIQPDGKLVVGGIFSAVGGVQRPALARLHPDGTLDAGFQPPAGGGQQGLPTVYALALQPDGKLVVARSVPRDGSSPLIRLNSDGTLDSTFNAAVTGTVYSVSLQADGQIVVGGQFSALGGTARYNVGRLHSNGSVDATFVPQVNNAVYALAIQDQRRRSPRREFHDRDGPNPESHRPAGQPRSCR